MTLDYNGLIKAKNNFQVFRIIQLRLTELKNCVKVSLWKKPRKKMITNLLRKNSELFAKYTCDDINDSIRFSKFSNELKQADVIPAHTRTT